MATQDIHSDLRNWKDINRLIEWKKFQYNHAFAITLWGAGVFVTMWIFLANLKEAIEVLGGIYFALLLGVLTVVLIILIRMFYLAWKGANQNIEWLYRKLDGQKV